jgi:predicted RNase H-like HicB family nuclease
MKGAMAFHLDGLKAEGMAIPQPSTFSSYVEIPT